LAKFPGLDKNDLIPTQNRNRLKQQLIKRRQPEVDETSANQQVNVADNWMNNYTWLKLLSAFCKLACMPVGGSLVILMEDSSMPCGMMCDSGVGAGSALINTRKSSWLSAAACSNFFSRGFSQRATRCTFCHPTHENTIQTTISSYCIVFYFIVRLVSSAVSRPCSLTLSSVGLSLIQTKTFTVVKCNKLVNLPAIRTNHIHLLAKWSCHYRILLNPSPTNLQYDPMAVACCYVKRRLSNRLLALSQWNVVEVLLFNREADLVAELFDVFQRIHARRQNEEYRCFATGFFVRHGEIQAATFRVLRTQFLFHETPARDRRKPTDRTSYNGDTTAISTSFVWEYFYIITQSRCLNTLSCRMGPTAQNSNHSL